MSNRDNHNNGLASDDQPTSGDAVHISFVHDDVSGRDEVRLWGTSSALPVDLSAYEWLALCRAIRERGEGILDLSKVGSRVMIRVGDYKR